MIRTNCHTHLSPSEEEVHTLGCEVHTFDPTLDAGTENGLRGARAFTFHPWGLLADGTTHRPPRFRSLGAILRDLGHAHLDVLKVDIEGDEWEVFNDDLWCQKRPPFDQLLIELHWSGHGDGDDQGEGDLVGFMHGAHLHGFRAFRREANVLDVQRCWEYAFVRAVPPDRAALDQYLEACASPFSTRHKSAVEWMRSL
jgi:hypothetical protein